MTIHPQREKLRNVFIKLHSLNPARIKKELLSNRDQKFLLDKLLESLAPH